MLKVIYVNVISPRMIFSSAILSCASWLTIRCAGVSLESAFSPLFLVGMSAFSSSRLYCSAQFLSLNLEKDMRDDNKEYEGQQ